MRSRFAKVQFNLVNFPAERTRLRVQLLCNRQKIIFHTNHYLGLRYKDNDYPREQARRCTSNEPRGTTQKTKHTMKTEQEIMPVLRAMQVNQTKVWEISRSHTVRSVIYTHSLQEGKIFRTKIDKAKRILYVTRTA